MWRQAAGPLGASAPLGGLDRAHPQLRTAWGPSPSLPHISLLDTDCARCAIKNSGSFSPAGRVLAIGWA